MNSQTEGYIQEIEFQKKMLHNLQNYLKIVLLLTSLTILLIYFTTGIIKVLSAVVMIILILVAVSVGLAIRNGQANVNLIIDQLEKKA